MIIAAARAALGDLFAPEFRAIFFKTLGLTILALLALWFGLKEAFDWLALPWIDIPGEVLDVLRLWRPTPLVRAHRLEQALGTPARIYYKDESGSPAGAHKPNTAVPQACYNQQDGTKRRTEPDRRRPMFAIACHFKFSPSPATGRCGCAGCPRVPRRPA